MTSNFRIYTSSITLTWETIKAHNLLNLKCANHKSERIILQHLKEKHNINYSGIEEAISEGIDLKNTVRTPKKEAEAMAFIQAAKIKARKLYTTMSGLLDTNKRSKTNDKRKNTKSLS